MRHRSAWERAGRPDPAAWAVQGPAPGTGERLFPAGRPPAHLECLSAERSGAAVLARYGTAVR